MEDNAVQQLQQLINVVAQSNELLKETLKEIRDELRQELREMRQELKQVIQDLREPKTVEIHWNIFKYDGGDLDEEEFLDKFIEFIESQGWAFGGSTEQV